MARVRKGENEGLPRGLVVDKGYLFIRIFPKGNKPHKESFGLKTPEAVKAATHRVNELKKQIWAGTYSPEIKQKSITVEQACNLYWEDEASKKISARCHFDSALDRIKEKFRYQLVEELNYTHTVAFRKFLKDEGLKDSTINRYHGCWRHIFNFLTEMKLKVKDPKYVDIKLPEYNPGEPVRFIKETHLVPEPPRERVVTLEEFMQFCQYATLRQRKICLSAILTPVRLNDLEWLATQKLAGDTTITMIQGKTKKTVKIHLPLPVRQLIDEGLDFTNRRKEFDEARFEFVKNGGKDFWFRDLRKSGPTILRKLNYNSKLISSILGHTTIKQTETYIPVADDEQKEAMDKVAEVFLPAINLIVPKTVLNENDNVEKVAESC